MLLIKIFDVFLTRSIANSVHDRSFFENREHRQIVELNFPRNFSYHTSLKRRAHTWGIDAYVHAVGELFDKRRPRGTYSQTTSIITPRGFSWRVAWKEPLLYFSLSNGKIRSVYVAWLCNILGDSKLLRVQWDRCFSLLVRCDTIFVWRGFILRIHTHVVWWCK